MKTLLALLLMTASAHASCMAQATASFPAYLVETGEEMIIKKGGYFNVEHEETIRNKFDKPVTTMSGYGMIFHVKGPVKLFLCVKKWNKKDERFDFLDTRRD